MIKIKITGKQIVKALNAVIEMTMPFARLIILLAVIIIVIGILLGIVLPGFDFGTVQATFDNLSESVLNFTVAGFEFVIDGGTIALTLLVLAVVFIVFAKIIKGKSGKEGKNM